MSSLSVRLSTWLRLQRDGASPDLCADALCQALADFPGVRQAFYLAWREAAGIYAELGSARLPPGLGDPLQASDQSLRERLSSESSLSLAQLRQVDCWLAGRVTRAGLEQGGVQALALQAERPGLLLVVAETTTPDWLAPLLLSLTALVGELAPTSPLLAGDPQPALLLDAQARPLQLNAALLGWLGDAEPEAARRWLPVNHAALVRACLSQQRAIESVEAHCEGRVLLWTFIPDAPQQRVLARCRDATETVQAEQDAARARRLYRLITENTTDLISRHSPDGRFLDASPASWTLLGYWPEQLRGRRAQRLLHVRELAPRMREMRAALEGPGYHTLSFRVRHRDGHYLWFESACRAIRDTYTGRVVEIVTVSRDITARVQAEENRRRLADVVEANTDLVLFIDQAGSVTYLNPAARQALGLDADAVPALTTLFGGDDLARLREGRAVAERSGVWSADARLLSAAGGGSLPVSLVLLRHRAASGEHYYSLVARDMRERELREAQQRRHQDELAHTARLVTLGELASGIAHEINQPLAAVANYASASQRYLQTLGDSPAAERVAQGLTRIHEHADHASAVIRRLRAFLRMGQRRMQALDVAEVTREAVRLCAWEADAAQVTIEESMPDNLPPVYADRVLFEQVLLNLLRNAIEANRERHGGEASRVLLSAASDQGGVTVDVRDEGGGLTEAELERIFTPFYTSKPDGLGLGLSMSRSIVEGFGGSLDGYRQAAGGLLMRCRLPLQGNDNTDRSG